MLELEFHPRYVASTERRKRKFEKKWDTLVKAFNDLDRTTDATMVLMAAPPHPHTRQLLSLSSRGIRRLAHPVLHPQSASSAHTHVNTMRASFARLASYHRNTRSVSLPPLVERIEEVQGEEELRGALQAALGSLDAMRTMYMQREERWREETRRLAEDGMSVQRMMAQTLGERGYAYRHGNDNDNDNSA
ncbi:hypothetical protein EXIGLDRAFT_723931 [Exidia glandulosa HHB12029]|uniref:Uncharacterized protein n=1 Tax=Exidia glandulosa HHB12029 TaxID=1314781 RepID=A0A165ELZ8_EXIGL|nr:hypothetical protein EXIGLDRAFT_723931 [Exidia glandulosa HHB12029]